MKIGLEMGFTPTFIKIPKGWYEGIRRGKHWDLCFKMSRRRRKNVLHSSSCKKIMCNSWFEIGMHKKIFDKNYMGGLDE